MILYNKEQRFKERKTEKALNPYGDEKASERISLSFEGGNAE
jgi:UDP-N-acetylglucosamine 2-epimerase